MRRRLESIQVRGVGGSGGNQRQQFFTGCDDLQVLAELEAVLDHVRGLVGPALAFALGGRLPLFSLRRVVAGQVGQRRDQSSRFTTGF